MKGLAPHTSQLFDAITRLECIKPFVLVGGTALSLQLGTRQSEDLDFMRWKTVSSVSSTPSTTSPPPTFRSISRRDCRN